MFLVLSVMIMFSVKIGIVNIKSIAKDQSHYSNTYEIIIQKDLT